MWHRRKYNEGGSPETEKSFLGSEPQQEVPEKKNEVVEKNEDFEVRVEKPAETTPLFTAPTETEKKEETPIFGGLFQSGEKKMYGKYEIGSEEYYDHLGRKKDRKYYNPAEKWEKAYGEKTGRKKPRYSKYEMGGQHGSSLMLGNRRVNYYSIDIDTINGEEIRDLDYDVYEEAKLNYNRYVALKEYQEVPISNIQLIVVFDEGYEVLESKFFDDDDDFEEGGLFQSEEKSEERIEKTEDTTPLFAPSNETEKKEETNSGGLFQSSEKKMYGKYEIGSEEYYDHLGRKKDRKYYNPAEKWEKAYGEKTGRKKPRYNNYESGGGVKGSGIYRYGVFTISEDGEKYEMDFYSNNPDLEFDPYGDDVPITIGGNQIVRIIEDSDTPFEALKSYSKGGNITSGYNYYLVTLHAKDLDYDNEKTFDIQVISDTKEGAGRKAKQIVEHEDSGYVYKKGIYKLSVEKIKKLGQINDIARKITLDKKDKNYLSEGMILTIGINGGAKYGYCKYTIKVVENDCKYKYVVYDQEEYKKIKTFDSFEDAIVFASIKVGYKLKVYEKAVSSITKKERAKNFLEMGGDIEDDSTEIVTLDYETKKSNLARRNKVRDTKMGREKFYNDLLKINHNGETFYAIGYDTSRRGGSVNKKDAISIKSIVDGYYRDKGENVVSIIAEAPLPNFWVTTMRQWEREDEIYVVMVNKIIPEYEYDEIFELDPSLFEDGGMTDTNYSSGLTDEDMVKENLANGEISCAVLKEIIGCEPNYPTQIVGSIKLTKCFLRPYYKID